MENLCFDIIWNGFFHIAMRFDRDVGPAKCGKLIVVDGGAYRLLRKFGQNRMPSHWIWSNQMPRSPFEGFKKEIHCINGPDQGFSDSVGTLSVRSRDLIPSLPRAVYQLLLYLKAEAFVDNFDAKAVSHLRLVLEQFGVMGFADEVQKIILRCGVEGGEPEYDLFLRERRALGAQSFKPSPDHDQAEGILAFFDGLTEKSQPHQYLKARLSYHTYIKSNRNVSRASRMLNISRTTLHDHLRLAERLGLPDDVC